MVIKRRDRKLEVKEFAVTDECEHCGSPQGGYVRDGHNCANCGVPEKRI